jgi:transposase
MTIHARAALTLLQRKEIKRLHEAEHISIRELAKRFNTTEKTIQKWIHRDSPLDKTSAPLKHSTVITPEYKAAVIGYRKEHPNHGPITIAQALENEFPQANRGTVLRILQSEELTHKTNKDKKERKPIPVGHHRIQMDIQTLPAVKGNKGREYKISMIHLKTRVKYSEIHSDRKSKTVVEVFRRGLDFLPPFF